MGLRRLNCCVEQVLWMHAYGLGYSMPWKGIWGYILGTSMHTVFSFGSPISLGGTDEEPLYKECVCKPPLCKNNTSFVSPFSIMSYT
jgi:hypothetical protein